MHQLKGRGTVISDGLAAIRRMCVALWRDDDGVTSIEYGLLSALIVVASIVAFKATGTSLGVMYAAWSAAVLAAL
jgi:pilus assembly protein Flp/PilA